MYAYFHTWSERQGGCVPEKHFLWFSAVETSPLIVINARRLFGEGSEAGSHRVFLVRGRPDFPTNNIFRHTSYHSMYWAQVKT
jgi:hypothetical protein